jgi:hypothetical protein
VAGAEFVRSTEVRGWAAVTGPVIDVMRKITWALSAHAADRRGADRVGVDGHHLVEFLRVGHEQASATYVLSPLYCLPGI